VVPLVNSSTAMSRSGSGCWLSRLAGSTHAASKALRATILTPSTPWTRASMSSSTMAIDGAVRASSRRSSASCRR
jgi:hypothetical protein